MYSGAHDQTIQLVESQTVQAGVVNQQYFESYQEEQGDNAQVETFFITDEYYDYNWTVNDVDAKFGEGTKDKIKEALLNATPEDSEVLELLSTDSFIETENSNYDQIRSIAEELGLI